MMDDELTITVPEDLHRQAIYLAEVRGATVENVVREAIAQYVSVHAPERLLSPTSLEPRTELGARLRMLRGLIFDAETAPLEWEDLQRELSERRGERNHAASHLR